MANRWLAATLAVALCLTQSGCILLFRDERQRVAIITSPSATVRVEEGDWDPVTRTASIRRDATATIYVETKSGETVQRQIEGALQGFWVFVSIYEITIYVLPYIIDVIGCGGFGGLYDRCRDFPPSVTIEVPESGSPSLDRELVPYVPDVTTVRAVPEALAREAIHEYLTRAGAREVVVDDMGFRCTIDGRPVAVPYAAASYSAWSLYRGSAVVGYRVALEPAHVDLGSKEDLERYIDAFEVLGIRSRR